MLNTRDDIFMFPVVSVDRIISILKRINVRHLYLDYVAIELFQSSEQALQAILDDCPNVTQLSASSYGGAVSAFSMSLFSRFPRITHLYLNLIKGQGDW